MFTFSLCMIVKNEEKLLGRCLDSLKDLMDEIIIVDTGSTDATKQIASKYTDKIYDFDWIDDFAAARNFAFSKATMDYIYCADADEMLDEKNQERLRTLKQAMLPQIEIVQMHYLTRAEFNTTQNYMDEYRPKLYKRLRTFTWIHPIHEVVRTEPLVFDSDVEILHLPESLHSKRDFSIFRKNFEKDGMLPPELFSMYAKELFISGTDGDFADSVNIAEVMLSREEAKMNGGAEYGSGTENGSGADGTGAGISIGSANLGTMQEAMCILAHAYRIAGRIDEFFSVAFKTLHDFPCSEICFEIGEHFAEKAKKADAANAAGDVKEALYWFDLAQNQTGPVIDIRRGGELVAAAVEELTGMGKN